MNSRGIVGVWAGNFDQEMAEVDRLLRRFPVVSLDTEFPGFLRDTPRDAPEEDRYEDVKYNVDAMKLIQLGLTLSDSDGNIAGTWEFNFSDFDEESDPHSPASISFLKRGGLNFQKIRQLGIPVEQSVVGFRTLIKRHRDHEVHWVCFHGLYDMAYFLSFVTQVPLPGSIRMFAKHLGKVFGSVYDTKYMARSLFHGEFGLSKLANILDVKRFGDAHQAGSDSLLTSLVFSKLKSVAAVSKGFMYGVSFFIQRPIVVVRRPPVLICRPTPYGFWQPPVHQLSHCAAPIHHVPVHRGYCSPIY